MRLNLEMQKGTLLYHCITINVALSLVTPLLNSCDHINQDV